MRWTQTEELPTRTKRAEPVSAADVWAARVPGVLAAWTPVGALVVVTLVLNLWRAGAVSIWYDEAWSYELASQHPHVMLKYIWGREVNMALYYAVLHVRLGLLQLLRLAPVEWLLRLPSAVCVALSAGVVFLLGRRWFSTTTAVVGGALYPLHYLVLYAGTQVRSYGLEMLLVTGGWYALFAALMEKTEAVRRRWWVGYAALMTLAIYAHLLSLVVFAAQVVTLALLLVVPFPGGPPRAAWRLIALAVAAVSVLVAPIVYAAAHFGDVRSFIPVPTVADLLGFFVTLTQGTSNTTLRVLSLALVGLAVLAATLARAPWSAWLPTARLAKAWRPRLRAVARAPRPGTLLLSCWLVLTLTLAFVASQPPFNLQFFYWRYLVVAVPPFALLVGNGLATLRPLLTRIVLAALLIGLMLTTLPDWYANMQLQDFRTPSAWLQHQYRVGDGIACIPAVSCSMPLDYYMKAYPGPAHFDSDSPGWWYWEWYSAPGYDLAAIQRYAAVHPRLFFVTLHWAAGMPYSPESQADLDWLRAHYRSVSRIETSTVAIFLFETTQPTTQ